MSESDDDVPIGQRTAATAPQISKDSSKLVHKPDAQPAEAAPRARKPPIIDDSDDDDDLPIQKPAAAKPKPKPKAPAPDRKPASEGKAPKSEAERALLKNESVVKREVEQEQAAEEQKAHKQQTKAAAARMYHNDLAAEKQKPAPKQKGGKAAKDGKPEGGDKAKREKKVYDMPGQTKETPDETDSLRKFYSSLRAQRPDSQMARKWLCQHGLLPREEAEQLVAELAKEKAASKPRSPSKPKAKAANGSAARQKAPPKPPPEKKRKAPPAPKPPRKNRKIAKKDDAFTDGGLVTTPAAAKPAAPRPAVAKPAASDASDDDDIPLAARAAAKA